MKSSSFVKQHAKTIATVLLGTTVVAGAVTIGQNLYCRARLGKEGTVAQPGKVRVSDGTVVNVANAPLEAKVADQSYPAECEAFDKLAARCIQKLPVGERRREEQRANLASNMFHDAASSAPNVHARRGLIANCEQATRSLELRCEAHATK